MFLNPIFAPTFGIKLLVLPFEFRIMTSMSMHSPPPSCTDDVAFGDKLEFNEPVVG